MQSPESNSRSADAVKHPSAADWMAFIYGEVTPDQKRELRAHLAQCPQCATQAKEWRASMTALDDWKMPAPRRNQPRWAPLPILKWAAAAMFVLAVGVAIGRQNVAAAREIADLKHSVTQLTEKMEEQRVASASAAAATASREMAQLLADYSNLDNDQRTQDRKAMALALREMETRLIKLRGELETVALNTETGFQQTRAGLTELASIAATDRAPELNNPESKNQ